MFPAPIGIQIGTWLFGGSALCTNPSLKEEMWLLCHCDIINISYWNMFFEYALVV